LSAIHRHRSRWDLLYLLGALLAVAGLVVAPLTGRGWVLLLDWIPGPYAQLVGPGFFGLHGGLNLSLLPSILIGVLSHVLGADINWLVLAALFPIAGLAVAHLVGRSLPERLGAALLYSVNPFVVERLFAGQPIILLAYAILPLVVRSLLEAPERQGVRRLTPVLWLAPLIAVAPQFSWIAGIPLLAVIAWRRFSPRALGWAALVLAVLAASCVYLIVPTLGHASAVNLPTSMLADLATKAIPGTSLYLTTAGLYGFWRPAAYVTPDVAAGWPFLLAAILVVAAAGAYSAMRDHERRPLAFVVLSSGVAGYFLALGNQGPTGPLFTWAYLHVPLFALMREAEIFAALVALAYAVCFAWGVGYLVGVARSRRGRLASAALAVALPLAYTPTIFWGLGGKVTPSRIPPSWATANRLMGTGTGKVLFLPWHQYLSFPFTGGRVIANPAPQFFSRPTIAGDNVQFPNLETQSTSPRGAFLDFLIGEDHATTHLGAILAPLGVSYVVLSKTVDWRSYAWLNSQVDITRILDTPTLEVWRNDVPAPLGRQVKAVRRVANFSTLVALADQPGFTSTAFEVTYPGAGPVTAPSQSLPPSGASPPRAGSIRRTSSVSYSISAAPGSYVELSATYQLGWQDGHSKAVQLAEGNMAFEVSANATVARYTPWSWVLGGYIFSALVLLALGGLVLRARLRGASTRSADLVRYRRDA